MRMSQIISQAMAIAAAWAVLGAVSAAQTHQHADQAANAAQTAASNVVVSVADFQALAKSSKAKIIDTRSRKDYDKGHIPGAISLPWVDLNVSESGGNRTELVPDAELAKQFGQAGLAPDDVILLYDATALAGRSYIAFAHAGFSRLHVLNGGISAWTAPLSTAPAKPAPTSFALAVKRDFLVDKSYVAARVGAADAVIIDARAAPAFEDGHIPSAKNVPSASFVDQKGYVRPKPELLKELAAKGVTPDRKVVAYCGSGAGAANAVVFLKDLGFKDVVFYDASWDEWSVDPKVGQEVSLPNFSYASVPVGAGDTIGPRVLSEAEVKSLRGSPDVVVLDVRAPADYNGGRIPDLVNVFWNDTLDKDRVLKPLEELKACTPPKA